MSFKELRSSDAYYKAACQVVKESSFYGVAAKTPSLLLPAEQDGEWRKKYFELARAKVKAGLPTTYIFSLPETLKQLQEIEDSSLLRSTLAEWQEYVSLKSFDLRYVSDSNFRSIVFGDKHLALAVKDPSTGKSMAALIYPMKDCVDSRRDFEDLKNRSKPVDAAFVKDLKKRLG